MGDVGQVAATGQAQDVNSQANINSALNNFYAQQQWPYQNLGFASNIIRGQNVPTNTMQVGTNYNPGQAYTASPLAAFTGTTLGATALQNGGFGGGSRINPITGLPYAKGGHVRRKRAGALTERYREAA